LKNWLFFMSVSDKTNDKTLYDELPSQAESIVCQALAEDIGEGDVTTRCTVPPEMALTGQFIAKETGVVAGLVVARLAFTLLDQSVQFTPCVAEGEEVGVGQVVATVRGPGQALLSAERVALNFLQRMSGIATLTHHFVEAVCGTSAVILDTRKTAPGLRLLDKWAVRLGGGQNHRFGLYDMALIKENHIAAVGGIAAAVARVRAGDDQKRPIAVEVRNLVELQEAVALKVDRILLDNMSPAEMTEAVRLTAGRIPLEASGNVTLENVAAIAATGVDYISIGMLTHSVRALDISLLLDTL
jgi:nicotinate-nucleotide pyrophosphorylase (carboxylating)